MSLYVSPVAENTRVMRTKHLAHLWRITRTDGTPPLHLTSNSREIFFNSEIGELANPEFATYTPVGGFDTAAKRRELGLKPGNTEFRGIIDDSAITSEDLATGKYRDAIIEEFIVDPRFPMLGAVISHKYWVQEVVDDGNVWVATVAGVSHKLGQKVGGVYSKLCPFEVFATGKQGAGSRLRNCAKDKAGYTRTGCVVQNTIRDRLEFFVDGTTLVTASGVLGVPDVDDDFFTFGKLTWTSGLNTGLTFEIRKYVHSPAPREISLRLKTPYSIVFTDTFDIEAGCDKKKQTCIDKFDHLNGNTVPGSGFGGFSFIKGPQDPVRGPFVDAATT